MNDRSTLETIKRVLDEVPDRIHAELWVDANTTLGAFVDMSLAALSHADHGGVKVKPLEWAPYAADMFFAASVVGDYIIGRTGHWWLRGETTNEADGVEAAKSAAFADYSARIMSAIEPAGVGVETQPWNNDTIWARFYRDGKNLGEICEEFNCSVYDLSPWLMAPLTRAALTQAPAPTLTGEVETPAPQPNVEVQNYNCPCVHPSQCDDSCMPPAPVTNVSGGSHGRVEELEEALKAVLSALVAATSILDRADLAGRRPSKVVGSDTMFVQMLKDFALAEIKGRVALTDLATTEEPRT